MPGAGVGIKHCLIIDIVKWLACAHILYTSPISDMIDSGSAGLISVYVNVYSAQRVLWQWIAYTRK